MESENGTNSTVWDSFPCVIEMCWIILMKIWREQAVNQVKIQLRL